MWSPGQTLRICKATAGAVETSEDREGAAEGLGIDFDNDAEEGLTVITITGRNEPGLLLTTTSVFSALDIEVCEASISTDDSGRVLDIFRVRTKAGDCVPADEVRRRGPAPPRDRAAAPPPGLRATGHGDPPVPPRTRSSPASRRRS